MNSFGKVFEDKLPDGREFFSSLKDACISEKDEYISEKGGYISKKDGYISEKDEYISEKDGHISEIDYSHTVIVWNEFGRMSLGGYHDLYLKKYVLLLTDVFENFINWSLK